MAKKDGSEKELRQESKESKTVMRGRRYCPEFQGLEGEDYDMWRKRVMLWYKLEGKFLEYPGGEVMLSLGGKAFQSVYHVELEGLEKHVAVEKVLEVLDKRFGKEKSRDRYDKILEFFRIGRKINESIRDYVARYEMIEDNCKKAGKVDLGEDMRCVHLLEGANIGENQRQMVLAYCGKGDWVFEEFKNGLLNVCEGIGKKETKEWLLQEQTLGTSRGEEKEQKRLNPKNAYGQVMKCIVCRSEYHFAAQCPMKGKWRKQEGGEGRSDLIGHKEKEQRGIVLGGFGRGRGRFFEKSNQEVGSQRAFIGQKEGKEEWNEYGNIWPIVDTGCSANVIGEK